MSRDNEDLTPAEKKAQLEEQVMQETIHTMALRKDCFRLCERCNQPGVSLCSDRLCPDKGIHHGLYKELD